MKLRQLIDLVNSGALKVVNNTVGGMVITPEQALVISQKIGWTGRSADNAYRMIDKTDRFIRNISKKITDDKVLSAEMLFESMRKTDSEKIRDRFVFNFPSHRITVLHGYEGLGGSYATFNTNVSTDVPVFACGSVKTTGEYINEHYDREY